MNISLKNYPQHLADFLEQQGLLHTEEVKRAFASVPRHHFVPISYQRKAEALGPPVWIRQVFDESAACYETVYSDVSLVTLLDEEGFPCSASSEPGIMAVMLETLEVQPGMRVLEIGTGSGYNAALLALLTGSPTLVTTIDIDEALIEQATPRINATVGAGMAILAGDGVQGVVAHAPYDRIIATVGTPSVPTAWYEQLAPGGLLVCILQQPYTAGGGVLRAVKDPTSGDLVGHIQRYATFMPLRGERRPRFPDRRLTFGQPVMARFPLDQSWFDPSLSSLYQHDFQFYLYQVLPNFTTVQAQTPTGKEMRTIISTDRTLSSYVAFHPDAQGYQVRLHGPHGDAHWNRLTRAYTFWKALGQPAIPDYGFEMDATSQRLSLQRNGCLLYPFAEESEWRG